MIEILAHNPSIPSIRFMALSIKTIIKTVRGTPTQKGMSCIPNSPYKLLIYKPDSGIMVAAIDWTVNFILAFRPIRSSIRPTI